jgi:NTE family protein
MLQINPNTLQDGRAAARSPEGRRLFPAELGQVVLVLQGGGALGAYQAGVYQALHEAGIEPDWVIGTSIGAINASLIAGNPPECRLPRMREFWRRVRHDALSHALGSAPWSGGAASKAMTFGFGVRGFFEPNPMAWLGPHAPLGAEAAGYYSTAPLERTLNELVDFALIEAKRTRLTVGAASVRTSEMRYFDSRDMRLTARHVTASGALPPAFPPIRIDGELYWDGGILSNTPVETVFDDNPRQNGIIFAVHIWNPVGPEPDTMWKVFNRHKDIQYSSRALTHIGRQKQIHRLRHIIAELGKRLPVAEREQAEIRELLGYACLTRMHVVRLLAPSLDGEDHAKDIDFSRDGIRARWEAGVADTTRVLAAAPWEGEFDPIEGFILHEASGGRMMEKGLWQTGELPSASNAGESLSVVRMESVDRRPTIS